MDTGVLALRIVYACGVLDKSTRARVRCVVRDSDSVKDVPWTDTERVVAALQIMKQTNGRHRTNMLEHLRRIRDHNTARIAIRAVYVSRMLNRVEAVQLIKQTQLDAAVMRLCRHLLFTSWTHDSEFIICDIVDFLLTVDSGTDYVSKSCTCKRCWFFALYQRVALAAYEFAMRLEPRDTISVDAANAYWRSKVLCFPADGNSKQIHATVQDEDNAGGLATAARDFYVSLITRNRRRISVDEAVREGCFFADTSRGFSIQHYGRVKHHWFTSFLTEFDVPAHVLAEASFGSIEVLSSMSPGALLNMFFQGFLPARDLITVFSRHRTRLQHSSVRRLLCDVMQLSTGEFPRQPPDFTLPIFIPYSDVDFLDIVRLLNRTVTGDDLFVKYGLFKFVEVAVVASESGIPCECVALTRLSSRMQLLLGRLVMPLREGWLWETAQHRVAWHSAATWLASAAFVAAVAVYCNAE